MLEFIYGVGAGLVVGAVGASVVWFFVWRNNKQKFIEALQELNTVASSVQENTMLAKKFKAKLYGFLDTFDKKKKE